MFLGRRTVKRSGEREGEREREREKEKQIARRGPKRKKKGAEEREEGGPRKARSRSPMEAKVYDASPGRVTDATTEALRSFPSPLLLFTVSTFLSLSLFLSLSFSLYTYVTTPRTQQPSWCIPVTLYTVRCNNVPTR